MAKDRIGNSLKINDLVKISIEGDIIGEIKEVTDGSLVGANQMVLPAKLRVVIDITLQDGSARGMFGNVLKVYNPKANEPSSNIGAA